MKQVIIGTGLSGLVGNRFVELFHDKYDFENVDLTTGVDILDANAVKNAIEKSRGEVVIHLAAFTDVGAAFEQTNDKDGLCYRVNVVGTRNVAQYCNKYNKHLIHISTDFVFDGTKIEPYVESDSPNPIEWYGKTKYLAEQEVEQTGGDYTILRLAYPFRAYHKERSDLVRTILAKLKDNAMYPAFTDHTITPTFTDDIVKVFDLIIEKRPKGETYHCVGSSWHTDYEIAQLINEVFGLKGELKKGSLEEYLKTSDRPYQKTMKISNEKLTKELGYKMKTLEQALRILKEQISSL